MYVNVKYYSLNYIIQWHISMKINPKVIWIFDFVSKKINSLNFVHNRLLILIENLD